MDRQSKCMALEQKHVHDVYERTAHHFSDVRYRAWPRVRQFLTNLEPASLVADVGCGSGKYLHINKDVFKIGCDRSSGLVDIAHSRHHTVLVCDNLHLPYRDNSFDAVISIGVIHHLTTRERRVQALRELARVLRPGGKLMVYVWAMEQRHRQFDAQDVLVPWNFQATFKHKRKKDPSRSKSDTLSDEEGDTVTGHKKPTHRITPVNRCRGLRHHGIGEDVKQKTHDCRQKRKTYHKQRDLVLAHSSHSRDGGSSSCASITSPSFDAVSGPGGSLEEHSAEVGVGSGNGMSTQQQREKKSSLKSWMVNLFSSSQKDQSKDLQRIVLTQGSPRKLKDYEYKQLICQIVKEDIEMYKQQRPLLEHSLSASDVDMFAVREFPQSSQPGLRKIQSLDLENSSKTLKCSVHTKNVQETDKNENDASHESSKNKEAVEKVVQGAVVNYNSCEIGEHVNGGDLQENNQGAFRMCQGNGHSSFDNVAKTELSCQKGTTAESKDDTVVSADISNGKDGNIKPTYNSRARDSHQEPNVNDLSLQTSCMLATESARDNVIQKCTLNPNGNKASKPCSTNGVGLEHLAMTDSSPESPSCESELNGQEGSQEGSSLSSPEEDITQKTAAGTVLPGLLEGVEEMQYPSLSDSDADEWAKVTVKAIRMMQSEVLRKVGTSTDSVSSRYAILGSSADLQDIEDEDLRSPLWLDTEPSTPIKSRYLHHGSCESSSLSSDPYTESEGDDGGQGLGDSPVIIDKTTPPAQLSNHSSIYPRRDYLINPAEKRLHTNPKSDLWNRRRMQRRYHSTSDNNNPTDTTSHVHKQEGSLQNTPLQVTSQPDKKDHDDSTVPNPSNTVTDSDDQNDNNIKLTSPNLPSQVLLEESSTQEEEVPETPTDGGTESHYHRYYHVFREGELVSLIQNHVQHLHILESYYDNANWCVVAEKVRVWTI